MGVSTETNKHVRIHLFAEDSGAVPYLGPAAHRDARGDGCGTAGSTQGAVGRPVRQRTDTGSDCSLRLRKLCVRRAAAHVASTS